MSGTLVPSSLDLNFTAGVMPSGLTFTRASVATNSFYTDAAGSTYTTYTTNVPRFIQGGLYMEESRANYLVNSDAPATQTLATLGAPVNTVYVLWVIGTGSATTSAGTAVGTGFGTATAGVPNFFTLTTTGSVVVTVTGSLTRFQMERGTGTTNSTSLTSYIPTTGAAVTRAQDLCTMPLGAWYNPAASTYYIAAMEPFLNLNACVLFGAYAGANRNGLIHRVSGNVSLSDPGSFTLDLGAPPPVGVIYQAIGAFRNGRQAGSLNGAAALTSSVATLTGGMTTLGVGSASTIPIDGVIFRARYWPTDLSNADLQAATAGPTVDLDFTTGVLPGGVSFSRTTGATYFDNAGTLQAAASAIPRLDYHPLTLRPLGLLVEIARTNLVPNPRGEGAVAGTPGTDPTGWNTNSTNFTRTIATGTERGMPYVEYRQLNAAAPTVNDNFVFSAAGTASLPMAASSAYMFSVYLSFPAGSFAGFTNFNLRFNQYDSGGGALTTLASTNFVIATQGMNIGDPLTKTRVSYAFTTAATCAFVQPFLQIPITAGAVDFTIRLAGAQVELGSQVTSIILPPAGAPAATLRGSDIAWVPAPPGVNLLTNTIESESVVNYATLPAGSGMVTVEIDDRTTVNTYTLRNASPAATNAVAVFSANVAVGGGAVGNFLPNVLMKQAAAFDGTALTARGVQNAGTITPLTFTPNPVALTALSIGNGRTSDLNGWVRRARYWPRILADAEMQAVTGPDTGTTIDISLFGPTLDPQLTFSRASTATYVDATGTIQYAAINAPRFGYDPTTRTPLGLLIEEARTNLMLQSADWSAWATSPAASVLAIANAAVSPDGTSNASSLVTNDTSINGHLIYKPFTGANSTTYVGSAFLKANTYPRASIYFTGASGFTGNIGAVVDLTTNTIVTIGGGSTVTMTPFPNGWYRVSVTAVSNTSGGPYLFAFQPCPAGQTNLGGNFSSTATGLGIFVWGAQVETAAFQTVATSHIPTTTVTVTRAADLCFMPIAASPWYSASQQGTIAMDGTMQQINAGNQDICGFDDGTINNCYVARCTGSAFVVVAASGGVGGTAATTTNTLAPSIPFRGAMTYNGGTLTGCMNAGAVVSTTGTAPTAITRMNLSAIRQGAQNGFKSRVRYWPRALSNAELLDVTSPGLQARVMVMA